MIRDYQGLDGDLIHTGDLDQEELRLVSRLRRRVKSERDWGAFDNYWMAALDNFYSKRGLSVQQIADTPVYRIAEDLSGRLGIQLGLTRMPDYRDELDELIRTRFKTRKEFCTATGLSETMVSHVLARRKHLAIDTLGDALSRIGYALRLTPAAHERPPTRRSGPRAVPSR